jgi:hypothetical protein
VGFPVRQRRPFTAIDRVILVAAPSPRQPLGWRDGVNKAFLLANSSVTASASSSTLLNQHQACRHFRLNMTNDQNFEEI